MSIKHKRGTRRPCPCPRHPARRRQPPVTKVSGPKELLISASTADAQVRAQKATARCGKGPKAKKRFSMAKAAGSTYPPRHSYEIHMSHVANPAKPWTGMTALVVDDHAPTRRLIAAFLARLAAIRTIEASDGREALQLLKRQKVDLVLSDWSMLDIDGLELLKLMQSMENSCDIPFIMVSAESDPVRMTAALDAGAANFILKPFSIETINERLTLLFPATPRQTPLG